MSKNSTKEKKHILKMNNIIQNYLDKIERIETYTKTLLPVAVKTESKKLKDMKNQIAKLLKAITEGKNKKDEDIVKIGYKIGNLSYKINKFEAIRYDQILLNSLFITLFSMFDAYLGELLRYLYKNKKGLIKSLKYSLDTEEIIKHKTVKSIRNAIIEKELDRIRRKNYTKQFESLEEKFKTPLKKFPNWSFFVEMSQRRNIITHCDGEINDQYIKECKNEGYSFIEKLKIGDKLGIEVDYFFRSINIFIEVGFKLGHVLWRKILHNEIGDSDNQIIEYIYNLLKYEKWELAQTIGEFGLKLKNFHEERNERIICINYAQAYKWSGNNSRAIEIIDSYDWSSSIDEFKLALHLIKDNFKEAKNTMIKIGNKSSWIDKESYHDWPLFREFRKSKDFLTAYKKIYKQDFAEEAKKEIEQKSKEEKEN